MAPSVQPQRLVLALAVVASSKQARPYVWKSRGASDRKREPGRPTDRKLEKREREGGGEGQGGAGRKSEICCLMSDILRNVWDDSRFGSVRCLASGRMKGEGQTVVL